MEIALEPEYKKGDIVQYLGGSYPDCLEGKGFCSVCPSGTNGVLKIDNVIYSLCDSRFFYSGVVAHNTGTSDNPVFENTSRVDGLCTRKIEPLKKGDPLLDKVEGCDIFNQAECM